MRTRCVGHACLEIETSGLRIVTDPWWEGPAFSGQWHQWPAPQPAGLHERPIDYLYLSHAHDDHFHAPTLKTLRPGAAVLIPELLVGELVEPLRALGFPHIIELPHGKTVRLRRGVRVTCYVNVMESILVIEDGDRVLVNANDALHSAPAHVIEHFCKLIRRRHPQIDTLFMNSAGNSWFPSCIRVPGRSDLRISQAYETLVAENFVRVVEALQPRVACANGASFVLVEPHNRWINFVRMEQATPAEVYRRKHPTSQTSVHRLLPNDILEGFDLVQGTTPAPCSRELSRALSGTFRAEVEAAEQLPHYSPDALRALVGRIDARLRVNASRIEKLPPFAVELRLRDKPETALRIEKREQDVRVSLGAPRDAVASVEMRAAILEGLLNDERGLDPIVCGHGAIATLRSRDDLCFVEAVLELLTPRPTTVARLRKSLLASPLRTLGVLWRQRWPLALESGVRLGLLPHPDELRHLGAELDAEPKRAA
jgi:L-ascorbate metabolism protein UlaG (beta-lactamase superfamily)